MPHVKPRCLLLEKLEAELGGFQVSCTLHCTASHWSRVENLCWEPLGLAARHAAQLLMGARWGTSHAGRTPRCPASHWGFWSPVGSLSCWLHTVLPRAPPPPVGPTPLGSIGATASALQAQLFKAPSSSSLTGLSLKSAVLPLLSPSRWPDGPIRGHGG